MVRRLQPAWAAVAAALLLAPVLAPPAGGTHSTEEGLLGNPVTNHDFEITLGDEFVVEENVLVAAAIGLVSGVLPRSLDPEARIVAPPWAATVLSGQNTPFSETSSAPLAGPDGTTALRVRYDARDTGFTALTVGQALAPGQVPGIWYGATGLVFDARADMPLVMEPAVRTHERHPFDLDWMQTVQIPGDGQWHRYVVAFNAGPVSFERALAVLMLFIQGPPGPGGSTLSDGAELMLDNVALLGSRRVDQHHLHPGTDGVLLVVKRPDRIRFEVEARSVASGGLVPLGAPPAPPGGVCLAADNSTCLGLGLWATSADLDDGNPATGDYFNQVLRRTPQGTWIIDLPAEPATLYPKTLEVVVRGPDGTPYEGTYNPLKGTFRIDLLDLAPYPTLI